MKHQVAVQQRFVVGIVLSVLLTCLFVFLSFGIYRCYRARKLRQGQAAQAAGAPEELQSSPVWPVLPAIASITSITSITAKPLLFGWDSRMTAEWPRGKVLKLTVGEAGFEGKGQRFPFRQADGREFCWEDGTVQRVEKIQKNVVWWRTKHERSEWQHFRWICTPKCSVGGHHDMELTEVDPYKCSSCSSSRVAEKHWHCPSHKVHLCPSCAELPPETPTLGVAANYVVNVFPTLASSATGQENPDFYAICPLFAHGSNGLGVNKICPRDGRPQCSVVDALEETYSGKVTHFVSWCWAYYLQSVVSAVEGWLQKSGEDPHDVFLWMCFFCNNQYRIKEEATQTGSEDLKSIFESHLVEAGRMLVLLETIERPVYITRAWCIFESYVCIARDIPMSIILPETAENFFRETVQTGEIRMLTKAVDALNVRDAKASSEADEDLIKKLILNDIGFDRVNNAVRTKLVDSFLELFRELFMQPR